MIVIDASTVVGSVLSESGVPANAVLHAALNDRIALSLAVDAEIAEVLARPRLTGRVAGDWRERLLFELRRGAAWFEPRTPVADCRDPADDMYLELALEAEAAIIVSSDKDLRALDPWRSVRIPTPRGYLEQVGAL